MSGDVMPKEQYDFIKGIQDYMLESTNMKENEAWRFGFCVWQSERWLRKYMASEVSEDAISREWLIKNYQAVCRNVICSECPFDDDGCRLEDFIINVPSVIPKPKEGEWILSDLQSQADNDNGNYAYVCTNCNHTDIQAKTQKVPYCWWCGARMKGAENDED